MTSETSDRPVLAVDIGTNTVNTLLAAPGETPVRQTYYTRLGERLDADGSLSEQAMGRALGVLGEVAGLAEQAGVASVGATATSACRDASNGGSFLVRVGEVLGTVPRVVSGDEEARLSFMGAVTGGIEPFGPAGADSLVASLEGPVLVVDIGGGSTELALGHLAGGTATFTASASLQVGSVRFTERYMHSDPPRPEELSDCLSVAEATLDEVLSVQPSFGSATTLVVVAGTAETIGAVELGRWDDRELHGLAMSKAQVEDVFRTLATEPADDRRHNPGLPPERVDYIVAGCCILVTIMRRMGFAECLVSIGSVRDAVWDEMVGPANAGTVDKSSSPVAGSSSEAT